MYEHNHNYNKNANLFIDNTNHDTINANISLILNHNTTTDRPAHAAHGDALRVRRGGAGGPRCRRRSLALKGGTAKGGPLLQSLNCHLLVTFA